MSFVTIKRLFALSILGVLVTSFASANTKESGVLQTTTIYVDAPATAQYSSEFIVSVKIAGATNFWGWQANLTWNPALMEFIGFVVGDFLLSAGDIYDSHLQKTGCILMGVCLLDPSGSVSGSGTLADVTFRCIGLGVSSLSLIQTRAFNPPQSIPWSGYGDLNGDGIIDVFDIAIVAGAYGKAMGEPGYNPQADLNSDGIVDFFDLLGPALNFGKTSPDPEWIPVEFAHVATGGSVSQEPPGWFPVTWRWIDKSTGTPIDRWYTEYVFIESSNQAQGFSYAQPLDYISFSITSTEPSYCNVTFPKLFMSGGFQVFLNDAATPSLLSWNTTHTSVYFTYEAGTYDVGIRAEIATRIEGLWKLADVDGNGRVNIVDIVKVAIRMTWEEP